MRVFRFRVEGYFERGVLTWGRGWVFSIPGAGGGGDWAKYDFERCVKCSFAICAAGHGQWVVIQIHAFIRAT